MNKNMIIAGLVATVTAAVLGAFKVVKNMSSKEEFNKYIGYILEFEGGYTNNKNDRGGETKYGICKKQYPNLDIKSITIQQAKDIYFTDYWTRSKCVLIPSKIRFLYFDTVVNGGGVVVLQAAAGVKQDSVLGKITLAASENVTARSYTDARIQRFKDIIARNSTQEEFKNGWMNRANKALSIQNQINGV
jgi:lysozyme family protein